jgi:hypothetical protein
MCSGCGFEFGVDDSRLATSVALDGIRNNWLWWRREILLDRDTSAAERDLLERRLAVIGDSLDAEE